MPIRKTRAPRRRTTRRPRRIVRRKRQPSSSYSRKVVIKGSETKKLIYLWQDTMNTNTATDHTSCVKYHDPLNTATGDQINERIGQKLFGKSVELNIFCMPTTNTTDCFALKVMFVRVRQAEPLVFGNATASANYANMYLTSAYASAYPDSTKLGLCQYPNPQAYTIVAQRTYSINGRSNSNNQKYPNGVHIRTRFPLNKSLSYSTGGTNTRDTYLILLHLINLDLHADNNVMAFSGYTRFIYKDY